jgi:3-deoxy-D-arabino-heptulosonate 7-phosphate (DAHP) synthase
MRHQIINPQLTIIAGPCSVDENNLREIYQIAQIEVINRQKKKQRAIAGTRVVGLKSRTQLNHSTENMGIDYPIVKENLQLLAKGKSIYDLKTPPSVEIAETIAKNTGMFVASEIMMPSVQLPLYEGRLGPGQFMPWNPSVNQLGWTIFEMANFVRRNKWLIGIKNGKWLGEKIDVADSDDFTGQTTMEQTWIGLTNYIGDNDGISERLVLIHRGVDVSEKGDYRNIPVHHLAKRVKAQTGAKLYFDPSHSYGPKMKEEIVPAVLQAMRLKINEETYLYDGILIEAGTSRTDVEQHISIDELRVLVTGLAKFRDLVP